MAAERAPPARAQPPPPGPAPGPAPGPEPAARTGLSLPGILHFIQHEWARFEAEKGRWEAERAELQAQVAFLQGERQGQESLGDPECPQGSPMSPSVPKAPWVSLCVPVTP
ncbi:striatin-4-like [Anomalospiza imberbis]|uniref:striatin-4-like n=1 Tax=Anomalospiza imberbis TaxID=187417 RepID=UPI00358EEC33